MPSEFGLMGMIYVFIGVGVVLIEGGLTESIVRTQKTNQEDYSSVFYLNCILSILMYVVLYSIAPNISEFYDEPRLTSIVRIFGLTFIISALSAVQNAILVKKMEFRKELFIVVPSLIIGGSVGVLMAYFEFGVWSLVAMALMKSLVMTLLLWFFSDWRPSKVFDFVKLKLHFKFGSRLVFMEVVNNIFANIYGVFIGKNFSASDVGFYTQGNTLRQVPVSNIYGAISKVAYPLLSRYQNDEQKLQSYYKRIYLFTIFLLTPIMLVIFLYASEIIMILFTEKWLPALPYLKILCFAGILHPMVVFNMLLFKVKGRSDLYLNLGLMNKLFLIIGIFSTYRIGIEALLWSQVVAFLFSALINAVFLDKLLNYSLQDQLKDLAPIVLLNTITCSALFFMQNYIDFSFGILVDLTIGIIFFSVIYIGLSLLFRVKQIIEIYQMIQNRRII